MKLILNYFGLKKKLYVNVRKNVKILFMGLIKIVW